MVQMYVAVVTFADFKLLNMEQLDISTALGHHDSPCLLHQKYESRGKHLIQFEALIESV